MEVAGLLIAARLQEAGITEVTVSSIGVDDFEGELAKIRDDVFQERLAKGYELSYSQMCNSFIYASDLVNPNKPVAE